MAKPGFDLNSFVSANMDYSRGYTFYATVQKGGFEGHRHLVKSSTLPASTIGVSEVNWQGNKYKIGNTQEFTEFTISYNVDITDDIRKKYLEWMRDGIHNVETNIHGDPKGYMFDITLEHLSHRTGDVILTYKLIQAWPSSITAMTLDYGSKEVATFDVSFQYQYFTTE